MNSATQTNAFRNTYRDLMNTMATEFNWSTEYFNNECSELAAYYMTTGQSKAEAYVSAATEFVSVNRENRDA